MRTSQLKKVHNFQKNKCPGHLVFQNEANLSRREAYRIHPVDTNYATASVEGEHVWSGTKNLINFTFEHMYSGYVQE